MKKVLAVVSISIALLSLSLSSPANAAGEKWVKFTEYESGGRAIIYGERYAIWDCWDSAKPTYLYVKDGGWQQAVKAKVAKTSCPRAHPYRHTYRWTVDAIGPQDAAGDYYLEFAIGTSKDRYPVRVQEFTSKSDQVNSYVCVLTGDC